MASPPPLTTLSPPLSSSDPDSNPTSLTPSPASALSPTSALSPSGSLSPSSPLVRKKRNFKSLGLPSPSPSPSSTPINQLPNPLSPAKDTMPTEKDNSKAHDSNKDMTNTTITPANSSGPPALGMAKGRRRPPPLLDVSKSKSIPTSSSTKTSPRSDRPAPSPRPLPTGVSVSSAGSAGGNTPSHRSKLAEQLATLDMREGERLDLRVEDLTTICELGQGNGGTVTKVIHGPTGKTMAKKLVLIDAKPAVRKQILRELQIMHDCRSAHIISFFGAFVADPHICICMEYMDKGSLDQIYKNSGPIPISIVGQIALAVLEGLTYLYDAHRIIHRDIKPSNVLFNSAGQIKLCDFGVSGELINSIADTFVGTSTYMSPERIQGAQYTVKSDVWSLGITLIELALGRFPFADSDDEEQDLDRTDSPTSQSSEDEPWRMGSAPDSGSEGDGSFEGDGAATLSPRRAPRISISTVPTPPAHKLSSSGAATSKKNKRKSLGVSLQGGRMHMSILELLQHIVNEPAPKLPEGRGYGEDARVFVASCLEKAPVRRPAPKELLKDPWIEKARHAEIDLAAWAETI